MLNVEEIKSKLYGEEKELRAEYHKKIAELVVGILGLSFWAFVGYRVWKITGHFEYGMIAFIVAMRIEDIAEDMRKLNKKFV